MGGPLRSLKQWSDQLYIFKGYPACGLNNFLPESRIEAGSDLMEDGRVGSVARSPIVPKELNPDNNHLSELRSRSTSVRRLSPI